VHSANMARVRVSIVFESGARIGPGKAKLLESIRNTGSISAAARDEPIVQQLMRRDGIDEATVVVGARLWN
jgi:hypothetical protein